MDLIDLFHGENDQYERCGGRRLRKTIVFLLKRGKKKKKESEALATVVFFPEHSLS